jgi:hypothetical protein
MYLVSDVRARVQRQLGDTSGSQIIDTDIIHWVNDAQREINTANDVLQKKVSASTLANVSSYSLPTDLQRLHRVAYQGTTLDGISIEQAAELIPSNDMTIAQGYPSGTPLNYWVFAKQLNLWPAPQTAGSSDLTLYYICTPTDVASITDTISLADEYFNAIVQYCVAQAYELDTNYGMFNLKQQAFNTAVASLKGSGDWQDQDIYPSITQTAEYY